LCDCIHVQAAAWVSITWHTMMPCAVFVVAYSSIFYTVRRQLSASQVTPAAGVAGALYDGVLLYNFGFEFRSRKYLNNVRIQFTQRIVLSDRCT